MDVFTMNSLKNGQAAVVVDIDTDTNLRRRLMEMGLVKGTVCRRLFSSPDGNMAAYLLRGCVVALRHEDSEKILLCSCEVMV